MKKLIDIPENIIKDLKHICVDDNVNPKNWIEELIKNEVERRVGKK